MICDFIKLNPLQKHISVRVTEINPYKFRMKGFNIGILSSWVNPFCQQIPKADNQRKISWQTQVSLWVPESTHQISMECQKQSFGR